MNRSQFKQRMTAWIACLAILMASLAPSISYALAAAAADAAAMPAHMPAAGEASTHAHDAAPAHSDSDHGLLHVKHCPFCLTHAGSFGLLPPPSLPLPAPDGEEVRPFDAGPAMYPDLAWVTPQSRAPPSLSLRH